jgi:hypothetical protein
MKIKMFFGAPKKRRKKLKAEVGVPLIAYPLISKITKISNKWTGEGVKLAD